MKSLANRVALVTGGAGGIGSAICEELAANGAAVVVGYRNSREPAEALTIRVVSVSPGLVDTEFIGSLAKAWRDEQAARTPLMRLATPQEIARAVVAMATSLSFATGVIVPIDGGRPLG